MFELIDITLGIIIFILGAIFWIKESIETRKSKKRGDTRGNT